MKIIGRMYFNTGGMAVSIVAVKGGTNDWAAYIGGSDSPHLTFRAEDLHQWTRKHGAKLSENYARVIFPDVPEELSYRR